MRITSAVLLTAFGLMWFAVSVQNTILFLTCVTAFLILISLKIKWREITDKIQLFFIFLKCTISKACRRKIDPVKLRFSSNSKVLQAIKPILKNKIIAVIIGKINVEIEQEIRFSGRAHNSRVLAQQSVAYMIFSFVVLVPISIVLGFFVNPYLFSILPVCIIWLFYPKLKLRLIVSERKSLIDGEMAFFTLYAGVMQSIGQSLYNSIIDVLGKGIFPTIENEGKMLSRNIQVFGMDPITALNQHGYSHPNFYFKNFLLGYASISKSGGNLSLYMERKGEEFFHKTEFKHTNYKSQAHIIGETMLILLTILPTMILISSFMLAENSINVVMSLSFVLIPVVTIFMILMIDLSQPKIRNIIDFNFKSIFVSIFVFMILLLLGQQTWFVLGVSVAIGAIFNFVFCIKQFRDIAFAESALVDFFRDVTEYRKIGIPIPNAIIKISEERNYNGYFDELVSIITTRLRHGMSLLEILDSMSIRSWTTKASLFVLGKVAESGGGTAEILEQITNFSTNTNQIKKEMCASVSVISYFALLSPILMSYTTKEMINILEKLNVGLSQMVQGAFNIETMLVSSELIGTINLLNVISAISLGLVMSKLTHFSMKHTLILGITVLISVLSVILSPFFPSLVRV